MGLSLLTDEKGVKVYRKDRETRNGGTFATYSLGVASKDMNGNWVNGFIDCAFKKDVEVNHKAVIKISKAFPTVSEYNDRKYVKWMILEFEVLEEGEKPVAPPNPEEFMQIPDSIGNEIPFV